MGTAAKTSLPRMKETTASKISVVYNEHGARKGFASHSGEAEQDGEGTWIFSYADMITILMMFFILLLSISSMDAQKFEQLKGAMAVSSEQTTNNNTNTGTGNGNGSGNVGENAGVSSSGSDPNGNVSGARARYFAEPGVGNVPFRALAEKANEFAASDNNSQLIAAISTLMDAVDVKSIEKGSQQAQNFDKMRTKLSQLNTVVGDEAKLEDRQKQEIKVSFNAKELFDKKDNLTTKARTLLILLSKSVLNLDPFPLITISAFMDNVDEPNQIIAMQRSNARAMAIFNLLAENKISYNLMSVAGYGHNKPLLNNKDSYGNSIAAAQRKNSRVDISIWRRRDYKNDKHK